MVFPVVASFCLEDGLELNNGFFFCQEGRLLVLSFLSKGSPTSPQNIYAQYLVEDDAQLVKANTQLDQQ